MMRAAVALALSAFVGLASVAGQVHAQHKGSGSGSGSGSGVHGSYAGFQARRVAALSDEEVAGILDGRGMGFALPAELNGYPGPMHVLELAGELRLTDDQRRAVQKSFDLMKERAKEAGRRYVAAEEALDTAFKSGVMDPVALKAQALEAEKLRAEFRFAHLQAHVEMRALLTPEQRMRYAALRGYGAK